MDLGRVQDREPTLRGTLMYRKDDRARAVEGISAGKILTDPLVSRHFDFAGYLSAYQYLDRNGTETMKVFIDV